MITTGYALVRYNYSGEKLHIIVVSGDLSKITKLKDRLLEQNSGFYSDCFEIEKISQFYNERVLLNLMTEGE